MKTNRTSSDASAGVVQRSSCSSRAGGQWRAKGAGSDPPWAPRWTNAPQFRLRSVIEPGHARGKSGGVRAIYYWIKDRHQIYMLVVYPKSKKDDLRDKETAILREIVKEL